ncbi:MAG: hypothetical protein ACXWZV_07240 [Solirubrobacterales bacterium]
MNNRTRVLSTKSMAGDPDLDSMTDAELKAYSLAAIDGIATKDHRPIHVVSFPC